MSDISPLALSWEAFCLPKEGHTDAECEDAVDGDVEARRFAISDGASESYAAGEWARLLVEAFVRNGSTGDWLAEPRRVWHEQEASAAAVSWYAEDKFTRGGHATFLGLTINDQSWNALACGDACLIHWRGGSVMSFPMTKSNEFSSSPPLIVSRGATPIWRESAGDLQSGDRLFLATDALAQCLIASAEQGFFKGHELLNLKEDDARWWVAAARMTGQLRNDDVALGIICVE